MTHLNSAVDRGVTPAGLQLEGSIPRRDGTDTKTGTLGMGLDLQPGISPREFELGQITDLQIDVGAGGGGPQAGGAEAEASHTADQGRLGPIRRRGWICIDHHPTSSQRQRTIAVNNARQLNIPRRDHLTGTTGGQLGPSGKDKVASRLNQRVRTLKWLGQDQMSFLSLQSQIAGSRGDGAKAG